MKRNESGILLIELLMYLLIVAIFAAVAVPRVAHTSKRLATKSEMSNIIATIQLYEAEHEQLPNNLNQLKPLYFADNTYKTDAWGNSYTYDKPNRKLCSTNVDVGCLDF